LAWARHLQHFLNELTRRGKAKWFVVYFFVLSQSGEGGGEEGEENRGEERRDVLHCVVNSTGIVRTVTCGQM